MKEYLISLLSKTINPVQGRNLAREYLQALILQSLQRAGAMVPLAFLGGTALRFLYDIQRYSEDLDFSLEGNAQAYDLRSYLQSIQRDLEAQGYLVVMKISDQKAVQNVFIRFPGLLYDLGLSPHRDEILAVKLEVDTHPPQGAGLETTLVRRHVMLNIQHHDRGSLMAGKLHALLQRSYLKGRDLYDLIWYLSSRDWPAPNLALLNNALEQTSWPEPQLTPENWRKIVQGRLKEIPWNKVLADVEPFLLSQREVSLLTQENLTRFLEGDTRKDDI
jgi:hypothetical protein